MSVPDQIVSRIKVLIRSKTSSVIVCGAIEEMSQSYLQAARSESYYSRVEVVDTDLAARVVLTEWQRCAQRNVEAAIQQMGWFERLLRRNEITVNLAWLEELEIIVEALWLENENLQTVSQKLWPTAKH